MVVELVWGTLWGWPGALGLQIARGLVLESPRSPLWLWGWSGALGLQILGLIGCIGPPGGDTIGGGDPGPGARNHKYFEELTAT